MKYRNEYTTPINQEILELDGSVYVKADYLKEAYNITPHRLSLWRQSRGQAASNPLRTIKVSGRLFLYNLSDIEKLVKATRGELV